MGNKNNRSRKKNNPDKVQREKTTGGDANPLFSLSLGEITIPQNSDGPLSTSGSLELSDSGEVSDAPKGVAYQTRVVAFVDFLGFKNLIKKSARDQNLLFRIYNALDISIDDSANWFIQELGLAEKTPKDFDDRLHTFSDFIVMSVKDDILEIGLLVYVLFKKCRELLNLGFACRGGIAVGDLYHEDAQATSRAQKVFGPAFIEAYVLESEHADGPRIILSNDVRKKIDQHIDNNPEDQLSKFFRTHIKRSDDGPAYIDLFADFASSPNGFYTEHKDICTEIEQMSKHISQMLESSTDCPHVFKKNAYLARLFNKAVLASGRKTHGVLIPPDVLPSNGW